MIGTCMKPVQDYQFIVLIWRWSAVEINALLEKEKAVSAAWASFESLTGILNWDALAKVSFSRIMLSKTDCCSRSRSTRRRAGKRSCARFLQPSKGIYKRRAEGDEEKLAGRPEMQTGTENHAPWSIGVPGPTHFAARPQGAQFVQLGQGPLYAEQSL